jgi:hypothetical protein
MVVQITIEIPDDLAATLSASGQDPARAALEAIALEAYRRQRLSGYELRTLLGISSRYELDGFLKERQVYDYTLEDFEKDLAANRELRAKQKADSKGSAHLICPRPVRESSRAAASGSLRHQCGCLNLKLSHPAEVLLAAGERCCGCAPAPSL